MEKEHIVIAGIPVEVWRKPIKNIHLAVYAPDGRVRISVPRLTSPEVLQRSLIKRMDWIRRHRKTFLARPLPVSLRAEDGELHSFFGEQYALQVQEGSTRNSVTFETTTGICLKVRRGSSSKSRLALLDTWYRQELRARIQKLLPVWQERIGEEAKEFRIKKMKTRWGTCNISARRLWINLELAKKPTSCLELILVHELLHLLERNHNARFYGYLDNLLPEWRTVDALLV